MRIWMTFVIGAVISWGAYGPVLHKGRAGFTDKASASMRSFLCVGIAYFLVGVILPLATLLWQQKLPGFTVRGVGWSLLAGILGALGAACIIWAFQKGGSPLYVMPIVFAGAPVINALISLAMHPGELRSVHPLLFLGIVFSAGGAWLILAHLPH